MVKYQVHSQLSNFSAFKIKATKPSPSKCTSCWSDSGVNGGRSVRIRFRHTGQRAE